MEQSAHSIFFVFDILQLIFDRSPFQAGTVVQASFGNHCLIHLFVGKAVGQVGCDFFHLCLCLGFQPFEPILGCSIFFPDVAVLGGRRSGRYGLRAVCFISDFEPGLVLRNLDTLLRGIHRTEVENFLVSLLRSLLSTQVTDDIDREIDDVQHRQYKGEYKV